MIFTWVLDLMTTLLTPVVNVLPTAAPTGSAAGLAGFFGAMDQVVAIGPVFAFLGALLTAVPLFLGVRLVVWLYRLVPGKFT